MLCKDGDGKVGLRVKAIDKGIFVALGIDHLISFRHSVVHNLMTVKFIYSAKATKFCEISTVYLTITT